MYSNSKEYIQCYTNIENSIKDFGIARIINTDTTHPCNSIHILNQYIRGYIFRQYKEKRI